MTNRMNFKSAICVSTSFVILAIAVFGFSQTVFAQTPLFKAGKVYTLAGEPISPGQILVVDGKIKAVADSLESADAKVVDFGSESVIVPGFVNAYTQTGLAEDGSDEISKEITPDFSTIRAIDWDSLDMKRQLQNGTTTMCICPGTQNVIAGRACIVKTPGESPPIRRVVNESHALLLNLCSDPASRNRSRTRPDSIFVRQPTNRMGVVWLTRSNFDKASRTKDDRTLDSIREVLGKKRRLFVVSRLSHDISTMYTLAEEFEFSPVLIGGQESYKISELLAKNKTHVVLASLRTGSTSGSERSEVCWNQAGLLTKAGVEFSISGNNLLDQAKFAHRFGLDRKLALEAITTSPAKVLGIEKRVGKIAAGMDADLVVLNGDPLELTSAIIKVVANGKIVELQKDK